MEEQRLATTLDIEDRDIDLLELNYKNLHQSFWDNHKNAWTVTGIYMSALSAMLGYMVKEFVDLSLFQVMLGFAITEILLFIWLFLMRVFDHYNGIRRERLKEIEDIFHDRLAKNKKIRDMFCFYNITENNVAGKKLLKHLKTRGYISARLKEKDMERMSFSLHGESTIRITLKEKVIADIEMRGNQCTVFTHSAREGRKLSALRAEWEDGKLTIYEKCFNQYCLDYKEKRGQFKFSPTTIYLFFVVSYTILNAILLVNKMYS